MSSPPSRTPTFGDLAPEVVQLIARHMHNDSLKTLRLVDKTLDAHAQRELFRNILLSPSDEAIQKWNSVTQHDRLSKLPRHATIQSREDVEIESLEYEEQDVDIDDDEEILPFKQAIQALSKLPNVNSLQVSFTPGCIGREHQFETWRDACESMRFRERILQMVFEAIKSHNGSSNPIKTLRIQNLQNVSIDLANTSLFSSVLSQLDELHLSTVQEHTQSGPDHDVFCEELRTFPFHLVSQWLSPVAPHLKALSLYAESENWGPFPGRYDFSSLSFPKLETLSLGYYTIAYDDQIDWILAQKSLTKLVLHNCMIATDMRFYDADDWSVRKDGWQHTPNGASDDQCYRYGGRWSQFFDKIADQLPNLREFRFDHHGSRYSPDNIAYKMGNRHLTGSRLHPQRYVVFDMGILPTHWPEANEKGALESFWEDNTLSLINYHEEYREEDQQSLDRLLGKCKERASKSQ